MKLLVSSTEKIIKHRVTSLDMYPSTYIHLYPVRVPGRGLRTRITCMYTSLVRVLIHVYVVCMIRIHVCGA